MARFLTGLDLILVFEGAGRERSTWRLDKDLVYDTDVVWRVRRLPHIRVPEGFVTDLASVPRLPLAWLAAGGVGNEAAVVHDWLYVKGRYDRATCDAIFYEALRVSGVSALRARLMWLAVRAFGGPGWKGGEQPDPQA